MNKIISLLLIFVLIFGVSGKVYAESMDTGTRIAIVAGSVFGVWLGQKLFHKKEKKSVDSIQKHKIQNEAVSQKPVASP